MNGSCYLKSGERYSNFSINQILGRSEMEEDEKEEEKGEDCHNEIKQEKIDILGKEILIKRA